MIKEKQLEEIRKELEESINPLFLFDDDPDGTCSYLILKKHYKKGYGRAIKTSPALNASHAHYADEDNYDLIVILDKPLVDQDFFDTVKRKTIWIDHHPPQERTKVQYYNPRVNDDKDARPTTYWAYKVAKSNLWIGMLGCIADYYVPDFIEEFRKEYPDLIIRKPKDPGDVRYHMPFGKLVQIIAFNTRGKTSEVRKFVNNMEKIESPYEILNQTTKYGKSIYERGEILRKEYERLLEQAKKQITGERLFYFLYPNTETSYTSDLANELSYNNPDKIIIVGRESQEDVKMSVRSTDLVLPPILEEAIKGLNGHSGGHDNACGCMVKIDDFSEFIKRMKELIK